MIGLEYILELHNVKQKDLADDLGIKKQNITSWLKEKQNISKKHLPVLAEKFGIDEEYFQKKITEADKKEIDFLYAEKLVNQSAVEYTEVSFDEETGQKIEIPRTFYDPGAMYDYDMRVIALRKEKAMNKIKMFLEDISETDDRDENVRRYEENIYIFEKFTDNVKNDSKRNTIPCVLSAMEKYENYKKLKMDVSSVAAENKILDILIKILSTVTENNITDALGEKPPLSDTLATFMLWYEEKGWEKREVWGEKKPENLGN